MPQERTRRSCLLSLFLCLRQGASEKEKAIRVKEPGTITLLPLYIPHSADVSVESALKV